MSLVVVVLAGTSLSERLRVPAPLLLVLIGVAASYIPLVPTVHLEPEIVLIGLLPPLLYTAALQTSLVDFRAQSRPILLLSVGLVAATTVAVGAVVHWLVPGIGWAAALAIGAVVAPPDAVAATAVARRIGLPRSIVTVLEGESLMNDATALVALRMAIAGLAGAVSAWDIGYDFVRASLGGLAAGFIVFVAIVFVRRRIGSPLVDTAVSFVTPFVAYLLAESVHASGVISTVVAGLLLGHKAPLVQSAASRVMERTTWRAVAFVLENAVFLLIGLQAHWILDEVGRSSLGAWHVALVCAATLLVCVLVRVVWMLLYRIGLPWRRAEHPMPVAYGMVIGWAGMRGVVTLAAAFVIPEDAPHRELLLLLAFTVVAGTLLLQGSTLPWLTRWLKVPAPDLAAEALERATLLEQAAQAAIARLDEEGDDPYGVARVVRRRIDERTLAEWERLSTTEGEAPSAAYARMRLDTIAAERAKVLEVRSSGHVSSEVVSDVLGMLDIEETLIAGNTREESLRTAGVAVTRAQSCAELDRYPAEGAVAADEAGVCSECEAEGGRWVALRRCLECGNVGCCDSSAGRHATQHFQDTGHPVMQSAEPGEVWRWCYLHVLTG